jgi:hypothetical protein
MDNWEVNIYVIFNLTRKYSELIKTTFVLLVTFRFVPKNKTSSVWETLL